MKIIQVNIQEWHMTEEQEQSKNYSIIRSAVIQFRDGNFKTCSYVLNTKNNYTYEDWVFLHNVSEKIMKIKMEGVAKNLTKKSETKKKGSKK